MLQERMCPVCGTASTDLFAESTVDTSRLDQYAYASRKIPEYMHHRLMCCRPCDLVYASPVPDVAELASAYEAAGFDSQDLAIQAAATYGRLIQGQIIHLPNRQGAIDIGTGEGAFLCQLLNLGFKDVHGVEPSRAPFEAASPEIKPLIRQAMFERGLFPPRSATLVTCFQTIEHVPDPLQLCRDAWDTLVPGGMICLVGHNRRSFSARMLGRKSPIFDVEHLQLFSPKSLAVLLAKSGFTGIKVARFWNTYPLQYWARLFPIPFNLKNATLASLKASRIGRLRISIPAGNLVAFGTRPATLEAKSNGSP